MIHWRALLAWGFGLWLAAGVESVVGIGFPGPLILVTIAAGFSAGVEMGALIGFCAGLFTAALSGSSLLLFTLAGTLTGIAAGGVSRYFSPRHLLIAMLTAGLLATLLYMGCALMVGLPLLPTLKLAVWRGGLLTLAMFPLYLFVLVISARHSSVTIGE